MHPPAIRIATLTSDEHIADVFALVAQLRPRIAGGTIDAFIAQFHQQQEDGYAAAVGCIDARPVVFAGYRPAHTLARGPHLFVDDLVTDESVRGQGHGRAMLRWLAGRALELGLPRVHLDSRDTARGFYADAGFEFSTSIPCSIDAQRLIRD
jgi:GNAT superfamily N-acetyltransferase